jgi:DNA-binding transcriptional ArsR family regulator
MADIDEVFQLTTLDQVHTMADPLRVRILERLVREPMTVKMLGTDLGEPPAKVHYHVRELERVGVIRLVETREKGGVLEKYFRAVARDFTIMNDVLYNSNPDELAAVVDEYVQVVQRGLSAALSHYHEHPDQHEPLTISSETVWATPEEFRALVAKLSEMTRFYQTPRHVDGEAEWTINVIGHLTVPERQSETERPTSPPRRSYWFLFGAATMHRADLEKAVAEGRVFDLTVVGVCTVADNVTPDLAERAIARVRVYGRLHASPDVRAVLDRKGGESHLSTGKKPEQ